MGRQPKRASRRALGVASAVWRVQVSPSWGFVAGGAEARSLWACVAGSTRTASRSWMAPTTQTFGLWPNLPPSQLATTATPPCLLRVGVHRAVAAARVARRAHRQRDCQRCVPQELAPHARRAQIFPGPGARLLCSVSGTASAKRNLRSWYRRRVWHYTLNNRLGVWV